MYRFYTLENEPVLKRLLAIRVMLGVRTTDATLNNLGPLLSNPVALVKSSPQYFNTDRSKAVLLLWFLIVTCSGCPYLYFGSVIMLVAFLVNFRQLNYHLSGKELFIRFTAIACCQFMYLVISLLVLRAGYGI